MPKVLTWSEETTLAHRVGQDVDLGALHAALTQWSLEQTPPYITASLNPSWLKYRKATDVSTHFMLQQHAEMAKLMLILNEGGWTAYTLPQSSMERIRQAEGNVSALCAEIAPEDLCQQCTFLSFDGSAVAPQVHVLGDVIMPGQKRSKEVVSSRQLQCPQCAQPRAGRFCNVCGMQLRPSAVSLHCPKCQQPRPGKFCNVCGEQLVDAS